MILAICPNPSMDCTMELDTINIGRLNRINGKKITYAGKALNVAIGVARLKGDSYASGFMFNENGRMFEQNLDKEGVKNTFVWNKGSVRTNYKIIDKKSMMTEINDKGETVSPDKQQELLDLVSVLSKKASVAVISGSLPNGVKDDYYLKLSKSMPDKVMKIIDTEGTPLLMALQNGAEVIKPNLFELENTVGNKLTTRQEMLKACWTLIDKGAKRVLLSLGGEGAIITDGSQSFYCKSINVPVNSTLGAGDSMVAAVAMQLEAGAPLYDMLRCGVAAGTASITSFDTVLFTKDKYDKVLESLKVETV